MNLLSSGRATMPFRRSAALRCKRVIDIVLASVGVVVLSPALAVIAVAVKLSSKGPVFYRGVRSGLHGKPFRIFKFRTMVVDAENLGGGTTAHNDPRVTPVGRVLRRYKLDELPQVFNVLIGDMSVVGPRPELPEYTSRYNDEEAMILSVRPGITDLSSLQFIDLASIVGADDADNVYEQTVLNEKNQLRLQDVREWTLTGDFVLIGRTIRAIFSRRSATA